MKKIFLVLVAAAVFVACSEDSGKKAGASATKSDVEIGLRKSELTDDNGVKFQNVTYSQKLPGESELFERSFENAPPLVPHSLEDLLPITADNNMCLSCHMPEVAADAKATAIPKSHFTDLRSGKDLGGGLAQARFECVACHVEQSNAQPLVKNNFKANFRDANGSKKSNLMDVLNQGTNAEF